VCIAQPSRAMYPRFDVQRTEAKDQAQNAWMKPSRTACQLMACPLRVPTPTGIVWSPRRDQPQRWIRKPGSRDLRHHLYRGDVSKHTDAPALIAEQREIRPLQWCVQALVEDIAAAVCKAVASSLTAQGWAAALTVCPAMGMTHVFSTPGSPTSTSVCV
jgi:hypothetical protein